MESGEAVKPKLRGKSLNRLSNGLSRLRGRLTQRGEKVNGASTAPTSESPVYNVGTTLVSQAEGKEFIIMAIKEEVDGTKVNIRSTDGLIRGDIEKEDLETKLKDKNGPWKIK